MLCPNLGECQLLWLWKRGHKVVKCNNSRDSDSHIHACGIVVVQMLIQLISHIQRLHSFAGIEGAEAWISAPTPGSIPLISLAESIEAAPALSCVASDRDALS